MYVQSDVTQASGLIRTSIQTLKANLHSSSIPIPIPSERLSLRRTSVPRGAIRGSDGLDGQRYPYTSGPCVLSVCLSFQVAGTWSGSELKHFSAYIASLRPQEPRGYGCRRLEQMKEPMGHRATVGNGSMRSGQVLGQRRQHGLGRGKLARRGAVLNMSQVRAVCGESKRKEALGASTRLGG